MIFLDVIPTKPPPKIDSDVELVILVAFVLIVALAALAAALTSRRET